MEEISRNLALLRRGQPPEDTSWLEAMTLGRELWLDRFKEHYLQNYIREGGSKVKVLVGNEGTGKTHLLRCVAADAQALGYQVVFFCLRDLTWKLSNIVQLYKLVAASVDYEELVRGLCRRVAEELGYGMGEYDGSGSILPLLVEKEGLTLGTAKKELRNAAGKTLRGGDLSLSFSTLAYNLISARMGEDSADVLEICNKWLTGEKLELGEKKRTHLYERLTKANGRVWLYALIRLLKISGKAGLVLIIDNMEALLERSPKTGRLIYTPNEVKDTYELIRQLIDDVELLENFVLLLSGRREVLVDENRGFASYEALWMRLQSGLAPVLLFNPWSDIVDVDRHLEMLGVDTFPQDVAKRIQQWFRELGIPYRFRNVLPLSTSSQLRQVVAEMAHMAEPSGEV